MFFLQILLFVGLAFGGVECDLCVATLDVAATLANSTSLGVIVSHFQAACAKLNHTGFYQACLKLAKDAADAVKKLPDFVSNGDQYPSKVACAMLLEVCTLPCCEQDNVPEQIYITFGPNVSSSMRATWITLKDVGTSTVRWGTSPSNLQFSSIGNTTTYTKGGWVGVIHFALMTDLIPGQQYYYQVSDGGDGKSAIATFVNPKVGYPMTIAMVGDMGAGNSSLGTIEHLSSMVRPTQGNATAADWLFHVGDISYADGNQVIWDQFGRQMQPLFSRLPYVTLPGNHEIAFEFASYRHRFAMSASPGPMTKNMFWAFDYGRVRFVGIDGEGELDVPEIKPDQMEWLLQELNTSRTRKLNNEIDWIVVSIHRPLYCSSDGTQCAKFSLYLRGFLEVPFRDNLVDIVFQAHAHNYERSTPVFNNVVMKPMTAPVYIVNGIGGSREGNSGGFGGKGPAWRVKGWAREPNHSSEHLFGYGLLTISSPTTLRFQIYSDADSLPIDDFEISPRIKQ